MWRPSLVWEAGALIVTLVPVVQAPESTLYSVQAEPPLMPEPPELSVAEKVRVTAVLCQRLSAPETVVVGGVVSLVAVSVTSSKTASPLMLPPPAPR